VLRFLSKLKRSAELERVAITLQLTFPPAAVVARAPLPVGAVPQPACRARIRLPDGAPDDCKTATRQSVGSISPVDPSSTALSNTQ
jgi:hypothetical protein